MEAESESASRPATSEGTPKLLDFSIAKILEPRTEAEPLMTATGVRPMTPDPNRCDATGRRRSIRN